jgi:UDP-3-O-acyl-N-acetylglucosamine deacetylase
MKEKVEEIVLEKKVEYNDKLLLSFKPYKKMSVNFQNSYQNKNIKFLSESLSKNIKGIKL